MCEKRTLDSAKAAPQPVCDYCTLPMNAAEHVSAIEQQVATSIWQQHRLRQAAARHTGEGTTTEGLGFAGGPNLTPPWSTNAAWAMKTDSDFDGIPDALDFYPGPGAFPPGMFGGGGWAGSR